LLRPGVVLAKDVAPDLPPICSDQDKVKQILLNLLSNAAKFTHQGSITLRVTTGQRPPTSGQWDASPVAGRRSSSSR
jgi:signal transduction histidine kinase